MAVVSEWRFVSAHTLNDDAIAFDELRVRSTSDPQEELGTVYGFIVDAESGQLQYVVVDSGGWFVGRYYLIPPAYTQVDAEQRVLWADSSRELLKRFPEFNPDEVPALSEDRLWVIERRIIEAYGDDPGVVAPSASWDRTNWRHYGQPDWWRSEYAGSERAADSTARDRGSAPSMDSALGGERQPTRDVPGVGAVGRTALPGDPERATTNSVGGASGRGVPDATPGSGSGREAGGWPDPARERAQPGDVLGIDRGGETTELGDSAEDEDRRRERAERSAEPALAHDVERRKRPRRRQT